MSTRSKMIRKAAQMPKGSQQRRLILHLLNRTATPKQAARKKDEFQIVDAYMMMRTTLDTLEEGAVGGPNDNEWDFRLGSFSDFRSMLKGAANYISADVAKLEWESEEDGRIETAYTSDADGMELSKREVDEWLKGSGREAYICDVSIYFRFARVWTPDESEITRMFKL